jgi:molybdate transport system ATP-binding protein
MSITARFRIERGEFCLDVDLQFPGRGVSVIFGPSGSGKTTLLRAIAGLEKPRNGYLKVGDCLWQNGKYFIAPHMRGVGYVFQEPSLFAHLNVQRNIEYGMQRISKRDCKVSLDEIVELLGIGQLFRSHPHQLSGGEQQRVAIARALAASPTVLLMDEPLASLDAARKQEILPYLESLHRELNIPILYVSHSKDEVLRMGDYMVLLDKGQVQATGSVAQTFTRLDLSISHDIDAQYVIETVVAEYDEKFALSYLAFSGDRFAVVTKKRLTTGSAVRLLIKASDVSITLQRAASTSILNILPATVVEIAEEGNAYVTVRLIAGQAFILARITRKSAVVLDLRPGKSVFVQIKSTALLS